MCAYYKNISVKYYYSIFLDNAVSNAKYNLHVVLLRNNYVIIITS